MYWENYIIRSFCQCSDQDIRASTLVSMKRMWHRRHGEIGFVDTVLGKGKRLLEEQGIDGRGTLKIVVVVVPMAEGGEVISSLLWHPMEHIK
jgi:hypothetical protein